MSKVVAGWRLYVDRRVIAVALLGFSSGLPYLLVFSTLSAWLTGKGVDLRTIGFFALVRVPYTLKPLWSPLIDRMPLPFLTRWLGRRRGWGLLIQALLIVAVLALGSCDPGGDLRILAVAAVAVAFLAASQDIVVDAYRIELLTPVLQGPGAGAVQTGYRIGMLVAGAGALYVASAFGWFAAYATMAALLTLGMAVLLAYPEPKTPAVPIAVAAAGGGVAWLRAAYVGPLADFVGRRGWLAVVALVVGYKLGEALAGMMAMPLYLKLGYSLPEIATISKIFGFGATVAGNLLGGMLVVRLGVMRALLIFGVAQSLGNLFYVLQAVSGHDLRVLALCVFAENLTGGMAGAAMVTYLSGLCNVSYTATQYALLSALAAVGTTVLASTSGGLALALGWTDFFLLTTVVTLPALSLLVWMMRRQPALEAIG